MTEAVVENVTEEAVEKTAEAVQDGVEIVTEEVTKKAVNYKPILVGVGCAAAIGGAVYGGKKLINFLRTRGEEEVEES